MNSEERDEVVETVGKLLMFIGMSILYSVIVATGVAMLLLLLVDTR